MKSLAIDFSEKRGLKIDTAYPNPISHPNRVHQTRTRPSLSAQTGLNHFHRKTAGNHISLILVIFDDYTLRASKGQNRLCFRLKSFHTVRGSSSQRPVAV